MTHANAHDARTYPVQVGRLYLWSQEQGRRAARELDEAALQVAAAEVRIARLAAGELIPLSAILDELTCQHSTVGDGCDVER
jgi:hypothetical protein